MTTHADDEVDEPWEAKIAHHPDQPWSELIGRCGGCMRELRREIRAWRKTIRSRCQRNTVSC